MTDKQYEQKNEIVVDPETEKSEVEETAENKNTETAAEKTATDKIDKVVEDLSPDDIEEVVDEPAGKDSDKKPDGDLTKEEASQPTVTAPSPATTPSPAKEFANEKMEDLAGAFSESMNATKSRLSLKWETAKHGYNKNDVLDLGMGMLRFLADFLPQTLEGRGNAELMQAIGVLKDYVSWHENLHKNMAHVMGSPEADQIGSRLQSQFDKSWELIWKTLFETRPYGTITIKSKSEDGVLRGRGFKCFWQRFFYGYDEWQKNNVAACVFSRFEVLLRDLGNSASGYPEGYMDDPELPLLDQGSPSRRNKTGQAENDYYRSGAQKVGMSYLAWANDCQSAATSMKLAGILLNAESAESAALQTYATAKQRKSALENCHRAWKWIGSHITDLWDWDFS